MAPPKGKQSKAGRPRLYTDPLVMEQKIDQYFDQQEANKKPATVAGLCYFLGFTERHALKEYAKYDGFSSTVKKAKLRIAMDREERLLEKGANTAGLIFDMVNNHDYKNPQHIKHSGDDDEDAKPISMVTRRVVRAGD